MSPASAKFIKTFDYSDSFKAVFPHDKNTKSHYYLFPKPGGTRIDRLYHQNLKVASVGYVSVGNLSDHMALICSYELPPDRLISNLPKQKPYYKIKEEIIRDQVFQLRLK